MMAFCVLRLGRFVSKVPASVVAGFSAGIGGIMLISQLHVLAGVHAPAGDKSLIKLFSFLGELSGLRWAPLVLGGSVMLAAALCCQMGATYARPAGWCRTVRGDCNFISYS